MPRRAPTTGPCCVPGCYRYSKKGVPFCERCWSCASDEERVGVQVAMHAPMFRRYDPVPAADVVVLELGRPLSLEEVHGYTRLHGHYLGEFLREFEARSTREAIALAVAQRRRAGNEHPTLEEEAA